MLAPLSPLIAVEQGKVSSTHTVHDVHGWKIHVSDELRRQESAATAKALELIAGQLQEISRVIPVTAVNDLRKVPIWFSPAYPRTPPRAEYHADSAWLTKNGRDPLLAKSVEFTNTSAFESEAKRAPHFVFQVLAQAYYELAVPQHSQNGELKTAFQEAFKSNGHKKNEPQSSNGRASKSKRQVPQNPREYFAQCSAALFAAKGFSASKPEQLAGVDSELAARLRKLWKVPAEKPDITELLHRKELGEALPNIRWLEDGAYTTLQKVSLDSEKSEVLRCTVSGTKEVLVSVNQLLPAEAKEPLTIDDYELSKDLNWALIYTNSVKVWRKKTRGDYWLLDRSTGKLFKVGGAAKPSSLMFAKLAPDGKHVGYVCDNNLYVQSLADGEIAQLTTDGSAEVINGTFDWVYEEEFHCRDGWRWSPDGRQIAYWQLNTADVKKFTMVDYTNDKYPILKTFAYPKTGEVNSDCRIGVCSVHSKTTVWLEIPGSMSHDFYLPRMDWCKPTGELVIQRINRRQNVLDILLANPSTGKVRTVHTERDNAWLDIHDDTLEWNQSGTAFTWLSEREGWRQLYSITADGAASRRITNGEYDIIKVLKVDEKSNRVYYVASPQQGTEQYLYLQNLSGNAAPKRLTPEGRSGWHDYKISHDGKHAIHTYSNIDTPPKVDLIELSGHRVVRSLVKNEQLLAAVQTCRTQPTEFLQIDIGGGTKLDAWMMKPAEYDAAKKYPVLFYVYGEPAAQAVMNRWLGTTYLWHLQLANQGYMVVCIDNRGTPSPRGRDWRKSAYRKIGTLAAQDQAAGARELLKRPDIDPERVGAWGWSGGGSTTLNLLFRYPEIYRTGMAVAAVPDMQLYNTIYQERYMGLPQENKSDYETGSPLTHVQGLKGKLLLVHGSGDDNCHQQGMDKLVDKMIELNLKFSMMSYPNRSHSIDEGKNTSRHLYNLLGDFLTENMPASAQDSR